MASSSSSVHNKIYKYDVFLSFRGEDTRKTFVDHLYAALDQQGISTFKDDERLEKGRNISDDLLQSIEDSRFYIIVFSKRYASSSWCLNELLKIMECCHETNEHTAFPVFYDVDPSEVRKQNGLVGATLFTHKRQRLENGERLLKNEPLVGKWREALTEASNLAGWDLKNTAHGHEAKVIKLIVELVAQKLSSTDIPIDENLIGMDQRVEDLNACLEIGMDDVRMIGIKGMGGAGKTTLAQAIFNKISFNFEGSSFVENVREKASQSGLNKLQEQILRDVLKENITVSGVHEGKNLIKKKLRGKKILIVLDDVDRDEQLEVLAGDPSWFKSGSRVIITTRDEQVLNAYIVKLIIDVSLLTDEEAIRLFSRHAFRSIIPTQEYEAQSHEVVRYAAGLPLTIKVLGSFLRGKSKDEWTDALLRLKKIPLKETLKKIELSYESLEDDYKEIFLDVACFLRHWYKGDAIRVLESRGFHATSGLRVLEQKCLIKIVKLKTWGFLDVDEEWIQMHDHIVEMGENIVRRGNPDEPKTHSRLWVEEEIKNVLANNLGTSNGETQCVQFKYTDHGIFLEGLRNMKKLRCLIINYEEYSLPLDCVVINEVGQYFPNSLQCLHWRYYPYRCLPNTFEANNLVTLHMPYSGIIKLWEEGKIMKKLKFLDLSNNYNLKSPDLGMTPNLKRLDLQNCYDLVKLDVHAGCLKSLVYLNIGWCSKLKSILFIEQLESLEVLDISGLYLREVPDHITKGRFIKYNLLKLVISDNKDIEVPSSIGNLHNLVSLNLSGCKSIKFLPGSICSLQHLRVLNLGETNIEELPDDLGQLECLETLDLSNKKLKHLPDSLCMLKHLKTLTLMGCRGLEKLPDNLGQLESLENLYLYEMKVIYLPGSIGMLKHLKVLYITYCKALEKLPHTICKLRRLKELNLECCERLTELPDDLGDLECLKLLNIKYTSITLLPPSISLLKGLEIRTSNPIYKDISDGSYIQLCFTWGFQRLRTLNLENCRIEELPQALGKLERLEELNLCNTDVKQLPESICMLKHLKKLILIRCVFLERLPNSVGHLESLEELYLSRCYSIRDIPSSICILKQLKVLDFWHCFCLEKLPDNVGHLESLEELYLSRCYSIREIPSSICMLKHLKMLELEGCRRIENLPDKVGELECLQELNISCTRISHLPGSISLLKGLKIYGFMSKD